jgi:hypothetical protein
VRDDEECILVESEGSLRHFAIQKIAKIQIYRKPARLRRPDEQL